MLHVHGKESSSTESGYQTIDEMTPSSPNEIFTNTWKEQQHQQQQSHKLHKQQQHYPNSAFGNASSDYGMVFGYAPPAPTSKYNDLTTPWHTSSSSSSSLGNGIHRIYSATPPDFPPPRFSLMEHTVAPPEPPTIQLYNQTLPHHRQHATTTTTALDTATAIGTDLSIVTDSSATSTHHRGHHQQQLQQQQHDYQLPLPPQPPHQAHSSHRNEKYQTSYSPQFIPPTLGGAVTVTPATNNNNYGLMQQQPKTFLPIKKGEPHTHIHALTHIEHAHTHTHFEHTLTCTFQHKGLHTYMHTLTKLLIQHFSRFHSVSLALLLLSSLFSHMPPSHPTLSYNFF